MVSNIVKNPVLLYKWIACIVLSLLPLLPAQTATYTADLQLFFVVTLFVILLIAFDLTEMIVAAILLPTLYFLTGLVPVNIAFASWTNTTVWMILGALIFATVLHECGLLRRIALLCINRFGGTYTGTLYGLFYAGTFISFITFGQAFIIMITLTYGICVAMKMQRSVYSAIMCFVGILGGSTSCSFVYNPGYMALVENGIRDIDPTFSAQWYQMIMYNGVTFFLFLGIIWAMTRIYKTHEVKFEGGAEYFREQYSELGPLTLKEKKAIIVTCLLVIFLFTGPIHGVPAAWGFMTIPYLLFFPSFKVGDANCVKHINFSIIFFISSCIGISAVASHLNAEALISSLVSPLMEGRGTLASLLIMLSLGAFCNLFMTPYSMVAALSMPFAVLGADLGIPPLTAVMSLIVSTDMIFFPHEIAACLFMYSFGLFSMGNFVKFFTAKTILTYIFFAAIVYPLWRLLGFVG